MTHDPKLLDYLESLRRATWQGVVFRYTAGGRPPQRENTMGARWNPRGVPAIYTTLERETAIAELRHHIEALSPRPTRLNFKLYRIRVSVDRVVDLSSEEELGRAGLTLDHLHGDDFSACQRLGAAAHWLSTGALLVPSARRAGARNLVIFSDRQQPDHEFEVLDDEPLKL